jgi:hypothetical protein
MFFSSSYFVYMIPAFILVLLAQLWVKSTYRKWSQVKNGQGISGTEAAQQLLGQGGLYGVNLQGTRGALSDHYDPRSQTLKLSPSVAQGRSVASLAITAHEIGHALQDQQAYLPLRFRAALVPIANVGSTLGWIFIFVGLFLRSAFGTQLAMVGVGAFALGSLFALATIPVELNASNRAKSLLSKSGLVNSREERQGVNAVLRAAAFTYIAALAASLLQLLYYISLITGMGGRRRS